MMLSIIVNVTLLMSLTICYGRNNAVRRSNYTSNILILICCRCGVQYVVLPQAVLNIRLNKFTTNPPPL